MSDLTERLRNMAETLPSAISTDEAATITEAADRIEQLEADLEWTRQQWVNGEDPMCEDVCEIACKGPCQGITNALGRKQQP